MSSKTVIECSKISKMLLEPGSHIGLKIYHQIKFTSGEQLGRCNSLLYTVLPEAVVAAVLFLQEQLGT